MEIIDFGIAGYRDIWEKQKAYRQNIIDAKKSSVDQNHEYILIGEHYPVYTLGVHGDARNLIISEEKLNGKGVECIRIERGGDITYHGPGQIVVYPIINLYKHSLGVKQYVHILEEGVLKVLESYGIKAGRVDGAPGIWLDSETDKERKISAIGVKISRGVSIHGLSLNVNLDLIPFTGINPCGFKDKGVTSIAQEIKRDVSLEEVKRRLIDTFKILLSC